MWLIYVPSVYLPPLLAHIVNVKGNVRFTFSPVLGLASSNVAVGPVFRPILMLRLESVEHCKCKHISLGYYYP